MGWFGRHGRETAGNEMKPEHVQPKESDFGFRRFQDLSPEEQQESLKSQRQLADERRNVNIPPKPAEDDTSRGERERKL